MNTPIMKSGLVITWVAIDAITPYENNPRKIPKEAIEKVAASIREFGFRQPIVVDKDMVVVVGHTRLLAARSLGYDEVPVLVASDLPPEKVKAYRLADNKTNEFTSWDDDRLMEELTAFLSVDGFDMEDFGFDMSFLDKRPTTWRRTISTQTRRIPKPRTTVMSPRAIYGSLATIG